MAYLETICLCPKFLQTVIQLHKSQCDQIRLNDELSMPYSIFNGVKQDYFPAHTLFSIFFSMLLKAATDDMYDED